MAAVEQPKRECVFLADTRERLRKLPEGVRDTFGFALFEAEQNRKHPAAKIMKGDLRGVVEIVEGDGSGTYRAMYTLKLKGRVVVLHVFQKKSKSGVATPQSDVDLIKLRLAEAKELFNV